MLSVPTPALYTSLTLGNSVISISPYPRIINVACSLFLVICFFNIKLSNNAVFVQIIYCLNRELLLLQIATDSLYPNILSLALGIVLYRRVY